MLYVYIFLFLFSNYNNAGETSIIASPQAISNNNDSYIYKYPKYKHINNENEKDFISSDEKRALTVLKKAINTLSASSSRFFEIEENNQELINLRINKIVSFIPIGPEPGKPCKDGGIGSLSRNFLISLLLKNFIKNNNFELNSDPSNVLSYAPGSAEFETLFFIDMLLNKKININNIIFVDPIINDSVVSPDRKLLNLSVYLLQQAHPAITSYVASQMGKNPNQLFDSSLDNAIFDNKGIDLFTLIDGDFCGNDYQKIVSNLSDTCLFIWLKCDGSIFIFNFKDKKCNYFLVTPPPINNELLTYEYDNITDDQYTFIKKQPTRRDVGFTNNSFLKKDISVHHNTLLSNILGSIKDCQNQEYIINNLTHQLVSMVKSLLKKNTSEVKEKDAIDEDNLLETGWVKIVENSVSIFCYITTFFLIKKYINLDAEHGICMALLMSSIIAFNMES